MHLPALAFALALVASGQGCVTAGANSNVADLAVGERPAIETDEAGLWMATDKLEKRLAASGRVIEDPSLNQYIRDIVCRLSPDYCHDVRIYIVRTPYFNASMAPNGTMQVWTGMLLRAENEAQLAYILGHELGHYVRRHSIQQWRDFQANANFATFFAAATAAAGVGYVGNLGQLAALTSVLAFSRDSEREADDIGFDLMVKAGYDPAEAAKIWQALAHEREASDESESFVFFSTHPPTQERIETLQSKALELNAAAAERHTAREEYLDQISAFRYQWLRDDLRNRKLDRTEVLLQRLLEIGHGPEEIYYFKGEMYRLRAEEGDYERATEAYRSALSLPGVKPETYRSLGLVYWKLNKLQSAREAFEAYLRLAPGAEDYEMTKSYLEQI